MIYAHPRTLAALGRNGDSLVGHLTPGDIVVPKEKIDQKTFEALHKILGNQIHRFTAGSPKNSINPHTHMPEFDAESAGGDPGGSAGGSGDGSSGSSGGSGGGSGGGGGYGGDPGTGGGEPGGKAGSESSGTGGVDTAAHAAEVAASPAGDPSTSPGPSSSGLSSEDVLGAPTGPAVGLDPSTAPSINYGGRDVLGMLGDALMSTLGYNTRATAPTGTLGNTLFGEVQQPGFNSNVVGNVVGLGIPGPIGSVVGGLINKGLEQTGTGGLFNAPDQGLLGAVGSLSGTSTHAADQATASDVTAGVNTGGATQGSGIGASPSGTSGDARGGNADNRLMQAISQTQDLQSLIRKILPTEQRLAA